MCAIVSLSAAALLPSYSCCSAAHSYITRLPPSPADGPLAAERPASAGEIRLIGAGKFLDNSASLSSEWAAASSPAPRRSWTRRLQLLEARPACRPLRALQACSQRSALVANHAACALPPAGLPHVLGDPAADIVVTLHIVLRKPQAAKPAGEAAWQGPGSIFGCRMAAASCCAVERSQWLGIQAVSQCLLGMAAPLTLTWPHMLRTHLSAAPKQQQEESKGCCVIC